MQSSNPVDERIRMQNIARREVQRAEMKEEAQRRALQARYDEAAQGSAETLGVLPEALADRPQFAPLAKSLTHAAENIQRDVGGLKAVSQSLMLTEGQRIIAVADKAKQAQGAALAPLREAETHIAALAADVTKRKDAALTPPPKFAGLVGELRAVLRTMPAAERDKLLHEARGDDSILLTYAIACAPAFMSGADPGQHYNAVRLLYGLRDPELLHLVDEVPIAQALIEKAIAAVPALFASLVDFDAAEALRGG